MEASSLSWGGSFLLLALTLARPAAAQGRGKPEGSGDATARASCEARASAAGYSEVQVLGIARSAREVTVRLRGSEPGQRADLVCVYRAATNSVLLTKQGGLPPATKPPGRLGTKPPGGSELLGKARAVCEALAKQQGYDILGSGPSAVTARGVRHAMALRRGTASYPQASCTYLKAFGNAVLTSGAPATGAQPR